MSTVKLKRSAVQGKVPTTTDLELGELAINTYDGKLYLKKDDGTASIVDVTATSGISDIVQDLTPQLGGDLGTNGNDILFGDNDKAIFGAGPDLEIYHDGSNSYVKDVGTGVLNVQGSSQVNIGGANGTIGVQFVEGANVTLRHNNVPILTTTSTGIDVTGDINIDGGDVLFEGTSFTTTLTYTEPTAARTITFPDATGTVALKGSIALATDTTGAYVADVVAGTGISLTETATGAENNTVTVNHSNSITAGTVSEGGSTRTLAYGGTFNVPSVTYDAQGHITATGTVALTLPDADNTNTTYSISSETGTGGTNLRLTDSSAVTDDVLFANGTYITTSRTDANTITIAHNSTTRNDTTSTDAPAYGGTFEAVTSVTTNATGHVTAIDVSTVTIPASDNTDTLQSIAADATNATRYITFVNSTSGAQTAGVDADLTYNPSTNLLSVGGAINTTGDITVTKTDAAIILGDTSGTPTDQSIKIRAEALDANLPGSGQAGIIFEDNSGNGYPTYIVTAGEYYAGSTNRVFHDGYHPNADTWTTSRTFTFGGGDVTGSFSTNGSADVSNINLTIANDSVALGTQTTGNYVATISGTANEIEVTGSGSETAAVTIGLPNDVTIGNNLTVTGNLTVSGTTTTVNTTNLDVDDAVITLNTGQATPLNDIGILMQRYATANTTNYNVGIAWEEGTDRLIFGKTPEDGADNDLSFSEEWMTIDADGNVGIGTTTPAESLDVNGDAIIRGSGGTIGLSGAGWTNAALRVGGVTAGLGMDANELMFYGIGKAYIGSLDNGIGFYANTTERLTITSSGNIAIGTTSEYTVGGTARLTVAGGNLTIGSTNSDLMYIRKQGNGEFAFQSYYNGNTGNIQLNPYGGDVGIGTTTPSTKLDVNGVTRSTAFQVQSNGAIDSASATTTATTQVAIDSWSATTYGGGKIIIEAKDGVNRHIVELLVTHDGTTAIATEYGAIYTSSVLATYDVDISGGNVRILATPASTNSTAFKIMRTTMFS